MSLKKIRIALLSLFLPALLACVFHSYCGAGVSAHVEGLAQYGVLSPKKAFDTVFSPILHSNLSPADPALDSLAGAMMPFFYLLNEKYPLYSEDAMAGDNRDQGLKKYLQKSPRLNQKYLAATVSDRLLSPAASLFVDILSNIGPSALIDRMLFSTVASGLPRPVTIAAPAWGVRSCLVYSAVDASEYSVYLIYSPFDPPVSNRDMYEKVLAYEKSSFRFFLLSNVSGRVSREPVFAVFLHDFTAEFRNLDRFDRLASGNYGFDDAYKYLRSQIEKKIISTESRLKRYRLYNFLPKSMQEELASLLKNVRMAVADPLPAAYIDNYSATNPLQIEMNLINQREQEKAVLKRFVSMGERFVKLKVKMVPRKEFDLIFKKIPLK